MLLSSTPEIEDLRPGSVQMRFVAVTEPAQLDWQVADRDRPYPGGNRSEVETLKRRSSPPGSDNLCPRQRFSELTQSYMRGQRCRHSNRRSIQPSEEAVISMYDWPRSNRLALSKYGIGEQWRSVDQARRGQILRAFSRQ